MELKRVFNLQITIIFQTKTYMSTKAIFTKTKQKKHNYSMDSNQVKSEEPIIPMNKVSLDVIKKLQTEPYPQLSLATHSTISEALELYYNEYARLFKQNQILNDDLASILLQRNSLADQFNQIKKMKSYDDNIRRRRRYASQIQRNYHCPMPKCNKGYGSEGSLTHHVRLKHPKFFQSGEYEIYLETYILPKQQIKNEDRNLKVLIDVQDLETSPRKRQHNEVNKIQISDNHAAQQVKQNGRIAIIEDSKQNDGQRKGQISNQIKQTAPLTPKTNSMMRQVDGYLVSQTSNKQQFQKEIHPKLGQLQNGQLKEN